MLAITNRAPQDAPPAHPVSSRPCPKRCSTRSGTPIWWRSAIDGRDLIYIDRHVLHELHAPHAFETLEKQQRPVRRPDLTFSMQDHTVATKPGRTDTTNPDRAPPSCAPCAKAARKNGIRVFDLGDPEQGISHVVAPELGMVLPGATHAVPDSHAVDGRRTRRARLRLRHHRARAHPGHAGDRDEAAEAHAHPPRRQARPACHRQGRGAAHHRRARRVRARAAMWSNMPARRCARCRSKQRMTLCNLNIEMGGRSGFVAPDDATFAWIKGRPCAPQGAKWDTRVGAVAHAHERRRCASSTRSIVLDCAALEPQITWGTDPSQVVGISGRVPDPALPIRAGATRSRARSTYMGLQPGTPLAGLPVNRVFIGSCTNARLPDLEAAAAVVRGRRVADGVVAMVVPGSSTVKREAEAKGLDRVFRDAGFFWGESGCSMCAGGNGDRGEPGERIVSTTNRNFENRQGPKRAHASGEPRDRGGDRHRRPHHRRARNCWEGTRDAAVQHAHRHRRPAHPGRHQHRSDRAGAGDAQSQAGLQEAPVHARAQARRRQRGSGFRAQQAAVPQSRHPGDRPEFRRRLLARSRRCGACSPTTSACIVARSFADIYRENCLQNGLLPVTLRPEDSATRSSSA